MKNEFLVGGVTILLAIVIIVFCIFMFPIAAIWSLNTLFPVLAISYNFQTWLAVYVLSIIIFIIRSLNIKR
jgi:hypothetical protein